MTKRVNLPTEAAVRAAIVDLNSDNGEPTTVVALARHLGLSNSTFWRHFPELAQEIADARRAAHGLRPPEVAASDDREAERAITRLRDMNLRLTSDLETAIACIRGLTIENQTLRSELEAFAGIARLPGNLSR